MLIFSKDTLVFRAHADCQRLSRVRFKAHLRFLYAQNLYLCDGIEVTKYIHSEKSADLFRPPRRLRCQYVHHFITILHVRILLHRSIDVTAQHCPRSLRWYCSVWLLPGDFQTHVMKVGFNRLAKLCRVLSLGSVL